MFLVTHNREFGRYHTLTKDFNKREHCCPIKDPDDYYKV